jgi:hypothetical protein
LKILDDYACDAALFSLFSIIPRADFNVRNSLEGLKSLQAVFLEEFTDKPRKKDSQREGGRFVVYHRSAEAWDEYYLHQQFGTLRDLSRGEINSFVEKELPRRLLGNCCILLCGESNGVNYSKTRTKVEDEAGMRKGIPSKVTVILNPVHDRMTRFEMNLKRSFLSEKGRWCISVWNKGKEDGNGRTRDGDEPPWMVFHNGKPQPVKRISNELDLEIGILELGLRDALTNPGA